MEDQIETASVKSEASNISAKLAEVETTSTPADQSTRESYNEITIVDDDTSGPHRASIALTLAIAYPKPTDEHSRVLEELVKKNKRTIESPKPIHFLHCEYTIGPENDNTATDLVTYAVAAKVFTDNDSRVVKTWDDGKRIWIAWIHSHEIEVTMENVTSLRNHVIEIKLWDAKEKVSSKARSDRPKAFRLPSDTEFKFPGQGVHGVVSKLSSSWESAQPRGSVTDGFNIPGLSTSPLFSPDIESKPETPDATEKEKQGDKGRSSVLGRLAGINPSEEEKRRLSELKQRQSQLQRKLTKREKSARNAGEKKARIPSSSKGGNAKSSKKFRTASARKLSLAEREKFVSMKIKLEHLFAGTNVVAARLEDRSGSVVDGFVTISTDVNLLPLRMERILNPLCIKIRSVKDLPNTPIPQSRLEKTSKPVYCQYNFLNLPLYSTCGRPHGKHVYFEDTHVIFLGSLDEGALREFIMSNSFHVEVHDRDLLDNEDTGEARIFGVEKSDEDISNVALVSAKRTAYNAFQSTKKAFDPFGVAKVPLVDILRGRTSILLEVTVSPCTFPEIFNDLSSKDSKDSRLVGVPGAVDRPERPPQPAGEYLSAGTTLKVKITLSQPLVPVHYAPRLLPLPKQINPFSRMIIYFNYKNKELLRKIETFVTLANARALGLEGFERNVIDAALSTFKLTKQQKQDNTLDIITGFHVIDGDVHLMVLEGLHEKAMRRMLAEIEIANKDNSESVVHLYDTSLTFKNRLYSALDVDLCRVRLHQSFAEIMSQPLIYIRDILPRDCLECVLRLNQILKMSKLRDVVFSNLFPSSEMVISMSREFGIPLTYDDFEMEQKPSVPAPVPEVPTETQITSEDSKEDAPASKARKMSALKNSNVEFEQLLRRRKTQPMNLNHVSANIVAVQEAGKRRRPSHPSVRSLQVELPAHNYSSQHLNTTEMAKNLLREMLSESDPQGRYSYHTDFNSAILTPVDVDAYYRKLDREAKKSWKTDDGFVVPGHRTSVEDNSHPLKPVESRITDLRLSFRDNVLHQNIMNPILTRENFKWENRKKDLNLFTKPRPNFGNVLPSTIMLSGDVKEDEERKKKDNEKAEWIRKLVVEDPLMRFHRLLWETEDSNQASQLDKLVQILKDRPIKYSLAKHPAPVLPPLSVVMNPSVDRAARIAGQSLPPAFDEATEKHKGFAPGPYGSRRWVMDENRIPITDEKHIEFAEKHGHDMNLIHKERSLLSNRIPVNPLTEDEYKTHLFRIPPPEHKQEEDGATTDREEEVYGLGPRERSEYRVKYPTHEAITRIREVYPRHTFHGFASLDKDGKPISREASIQLVTSYGADGSYEVNNRPEKEASVQIDSGSKQAASVEVA